MSSTINRSPDRIHHEVPGKSPLSRVRKPLLICGIAASLLYGAMIIFNGLEVSDFAERLKALEAAKHHHDDRSAFDEKDELGKRFNWNS